MSGSVLNLVQGSDGRRPSNRCVCMCVCVCAGRVPCPSVETCAVLIAYN